VAAGSSVHGDCYAILVALALHGAFSSVFGLFALFTKPRRPGLAKQSIGKTED